MEDRMETIQSPHFDKDKFKSQLEILAQFQELGQ